MYREHSFETRLSGLDRGRYAGGARQVDPARLSADALGRLVRAVNDEAPPSRLTVAPASNDWVDHLSLRGRWGFIMPFLLVMLTFSVGLSDWECRWTWQPVTIFVAYTLATTIFFARLFMLVRRRSNLHRFSPGIYMFPVDIVVIEPRRTDGKQYLTVHPLGGARGVRVVTLQSGVNELHIRFEDSTTLRAPWPGSLENLVEHLASAQQMLEVMTTKNAFDHAFERDLFWEQRVDNSWSTVAPEADSDKPSQASQPPRHRSRLTALVLRRRAVHIVLTLGVMAASAGFGLRRWFVESQHYADAIAYQTPEALEDYLADGGWFRSTAQAEIRAIAERRKRAKEQRDTLAARQRATSIADGVAVPPAPPSPEKCLRAFTAASTKPSPAVVSMMTRIFANTDHSHGLTIAFRQLFDSSKVRWPGDQTDRLLDEHEMTLVRSFDDVFSKLCPASVVMYFRHNGGSPRSAAFEILYQIEPTNKQYVDPITNAVDRALQFTFDVTFHVPGEPVERQNAKVHFVVAPPDDRPTEALPGSRFSVEPAQKKSYFDEYRVEHKYVADNRVFHAQSSRAFDKLYAEMNLLFYGSEPRLPPNP